MVGGFTFRLVKIFGVVLMASLNLEAARVLSSRTDRKPPSVSILSPATGSTYTSPSTISIEVSASDNMAVSQVALLLDGQKVSTLAAGPYTFSLNLTSDLNGTHFLTAVATDSSQNSKTSTAVELKVNIVGNAVTTTTLDVIPPTIPTGITVGVV
jgi:hypothetical protein